MNKLFKVLLGILPLILGCEASAQTTDYKLTYGGYWDFDRPGFRMVAHPITGNLLVVNRKTSSDATGSMFEFDKDSLKLVNHFFQENEGDTAFSSINFVLDLQGNYYSASDDRVLKFDPSHKYLGVFLKPEGREVNDRYSNLITLGSDGNIYYSTSKDTIYGHDPVTGVEVAKLGIGKGSAANKFGNLADMYFDSRQPYLYTADGIKSRICKHDMQGNFIKCVGKKGKGPGDFEFGAGEIAVGDDGKVYALDNDIDIQVYDNELNYLYELPKYTHTCCQLSTKDIATGSNGVVYLLDWNIGLVKYTPQNVSTVRDGQLLGELKIYPSPSTNGHFVVDTPEPLVEVSLLNSMGQQESYTSADIHTSMSGLLFMKARLASGRELVGKIIVE